MASPQDEVTREPADDRLLDVVVVGGSQSGLAMAWHLQRQGLNFVVLEAGPVVSGRIEPTLDRSTVRSTESGLPRPQRPRARSGPCRGSPQGGVLRPTTIPTRSGSGPSSSAGRSGHVSRVAGRCRPHLGMVTISP